MSDNQSSYMKILISLITALVTLLTITLPYNMWAESRARNSKVISILAATYNEMRANSRSLQIDINPVVSTTVLVTLIKDTDTYKVMPSSFFATLPRIYQRLVNIEHSIDNKKSIKEATAYSLPEMISILKTMYKHGEALNSSKWKEMVNLANGEKIQIILSELEQETSMIGTPREILTLRNRTELYEKICNIIERLKDAELESHQNDIEYLYRFAAENKLEMPGVMKEEMLKDIKKIEYVQIVPESRSYMKFEVINKLRRKKNYDIWREWLGIRIDTLEKSMWDNTDR